MVQNRDSGLLPAVRMPGGVHYRQDHEPPGLDFIESGEGEAVDPGSPDSVMHQMGALWECQKPLNQAVERRKKAVGESRGEVGVEIAGSLQV